VVIDTEQRRILDAHLSPRTGDELHPPTYSLTLTKRQIALLIEAISHFHATRCPLHGRGDTCDGLSWYESPATGAMELYCPTSCSALVNQVVDQVIPVASLGLKGRLIPPD
jgi:hypothetical protein